MGMCDGRKLHTPLSHSVEDMRQGKRPVKKDPLDGLQNLYAYIDAETPSAASASMLGVITSGLR
jgi:hypothetical protein